jgi:hypothetical protein
MEDDQTGSLWSQISGECINGALLGKKLDMYPAQFSTFGALKSNDAVRFLIKPEAGQDNSVYKDYFEDRARMGIFGTMSNDSLMQGKDIVYGLRTTDRQLAVPQNLFAKRPAFLVTLDTLNLIIIASDDGDVVAYRLPGATDDWILKFDDNRITLMATGDDREAICFEEGTQIKGKALANYPVVTAFWFAWKAFFPSGTVYGL